MGKLHSTALFIFLMVALLAGKETERNWTELVESLQDIEWEEIKEFIDGQKEQKRRNDENNGNNANSGKGTENGDNNRDNEDDERETIDKIKNGEITDPETVYGYLTYDRFDWTSEFCLQCLFEDFKNNTDMCFGKNTTTTTTSVTGLVFKRTNTYDCWWCSSCYK